MDFFHKRSLKPLPLLVGILVLVSLPGFAGPRLSHSKSLFAFMKERAVLARAYLRSDQLPIAEKNRRLFMEVNRAGRALEDSRLQLSEWVYDSIKSRILAARKNIRMSQAWLGRNDRARATRYLASLDSDLDSALNRISWIELATGGFLLTSADQTLPGATRRSN